MWKATCSTTRNNSGLGPFPEVAEEIVKAHKGYWD